MELLFLALFAASLIACVVTGASVVFALVFGYILFFFYGLIHGKSVKEMLRFSRNGIFTVKNVLLTLLLISMLTAIWRACGSIAYIVYYASAICTPSVMLLASFLLCCLISFLTGTSFGSAATIGVICMTMANSMGIPAFLTGRRNPGRDFFRGPVFSCFHQCTSCQRAERKQIFFPISGI